MEETEARGYGFSGSVIDDNAPKTHEHKNQEHETPKHEEYTEPDHQIPDHTTPDKMPEKTPPAFTDTPTSTVYPEVKDEFKPGPNLVQQNSEPAAVASVPILNAPTDDRPVPVVKVLSVRGVEYAMMSILLWIGAGTLIFVLVSLIMGGASFEMLAFPISLLLVCLPGFAWLYLRLRKAELDDPSLRLEASKRRFSQITQILAFLTCFFNIVALVYMVVGMAGGKEVENLGQTVAATFVTLLVAGGILAYYWFDEHKLVGR